jgi:hypothetical protein
MATGSFLTHFLEYVSEEQPARAKEVLPSQPGKGQERQAKRKLRASGEDQAQSGFSHCHKLQSKLTPASRTEARNIRRPVSIIFH